MITHDFMNIDNTQFYASAGSDEQKNHITKSECFDCNQKKHQHKNCSMNSYSKICQVTVFNENSQFTSQKIYTASLIKFMISQKSSALLHVITSHIMLSNKLKNESF